MFPDPLETEEPQAMTGNVGSCYTCGRNLAQLQQEYQVRKEYRYREGTAKNPGRLIAYFMTLCVWCDYQWRQSGADHRR